MPIVETTGSAISHSTARAFGSAIANTTGSAISSSSAAGIGAAVHNTVGLARTSSRQSFGLIGAAVVETFARIRETKAVTSGAIAAVIDTIGSSTSSSSADASGEAWSIAGGKVLKFVTILYASQGWEVPVFQRLLILALYGPQFSEGVRLYRWALFYIPRKNFKSTLLAALGLYHLLADGERDPKIYIVTPALDNCREIFEAMSNFVHDVPQLRRKQLSGRIKITDNENRKQITLYNSEGRRIGYISAQTSGGRTKHGKNPSVVLFDEAHQLRDEEQWRAMTTGSMQRKQPLWFVASTAGDDAAGIFHDMLERARRIATGIITEARFLPLLYEASSKDDQGDPEVWKRCNWQPPWQPSSWDLGDL